MSKLVANLVVYGFMAALALCGFFGSRRAQEEQEELEANKIVLETLADADLVREVEFHSLKNLRDQLTIEEVQALYERQRLLEMGDRRH